MDQSLLSALTVVLGVAAITTVLFNKIHQSVILGYILAGLMIGPHVPIPLVADKEVVTILSELGVILLLFSIGLDFSLKKLIAIAPTAGLIAIVQVSLMVWFGFLLGKQFGFGQLESLFAGAMIATSSTTIMVKVFEEQKVSGKFRDIAMAVQVADDLLAIILLAVLTTLASGQGLSGKALAITTGGLAIFLVALTIIGMLIVPKFIRFIVKMNKPETLLIATVGICFSIALLVKEFGYSTALGAFLAGALVSESGKGVQIEKLVRPTKFIFGAIFFVSVGMSIDPVLVVHNWSAVIAFTLLVLIGQVIAASFGTFLTGQNVKTSIQTGMCLANTGEFSFILAAMAISLGVAGNYLFPIAVSVSVLTTIVTPHYIRIADRVARAIDNRLPHPIQTFVSLYGSWMDRLHNRQSTTQEKSKIQRYAKLLIVDSILLCIVIIVGGYLSEISNYIEESLQLTAQIAFWSVATLLLIIGIPLFAGVLALTNRLASLLALAAFPMNTEGLDSAQTPRKAMRVTLSAAGVFLVVIPIVAISHPLYPSGSLAIVLGLLIIIFGIIFWRSSVNLDGHVRAGSQLIAEVLSMHSYTPTASGNAESMDIVYKLLPGLGEPVVFTLHEQCSCIGKSILELNIRGKTGATIVAIHRTDGKTLFPTAEDILYAGDRLAISGSHDSIQQVKDLLFNS